MTRAYRICGAGLVALLAATGCSGNPSPSQEVGVASLKRERDVITREELENSPHRLVDLYQAVRGLRPHFLAAPLGNRTRVYPTQVYIDGVRQQNGLATLQGIPTATVERVEYLDPGRAESQLGSTAGGGAVMVTLTGQHRVPASARDTTAQQ